MPKLTASKITEINADLRKAVQEVLNKHGLTFSKSVHAKYTDSFADIKFQYSVGGEKHANESFNFKNYYWKYGMEVSDLGKVFMHQGNKYRIVGSRTRAKKAPIVIEKVNDGSVYNAPANVVLNGLGKETPKFM